MDGWTDIRTDGRTDRPYYRDARTHLKKAVGKNGNVSTLTEGKKLEALPHMQQRIYHDGSIFVPAVVMDLLW